MKPSTQEWIEKAEGDFIAAVTLLRTRKQTNYDTVCYHTQQCAEKYLKARLEEAGQPIPRTHNLYALLTLVKAFEPSWQALATDLNVLNSFAVVFRYPGATATKIDALDALRRCRSIRRLIRSSFGLPV
ncbi:MAG: HEPN domain-containing protein [Acidobacteria bacterium]|nr:HEPN domain-containing protein [Acidobacteriota bacterium]MBI3424576.1 HEPN domain-containing protein [Acidobacteriota bacterium]